MKLALRIVLITAVACGGAHVASAQKAYDELGLRLGWGGGLSFKTGYHSGWFHEVAMGPRWGGANATFLVGREFPLGDTRLLINGGGGVQLGLYRRHNHIGGSEGSKAVYVNPAMALVGGLDYPLAEVPVTVGVSYLPAFVFSADRVFVGENIHFVLRYRWQP